jgi:hypothetical protein
MWVFTLHRNSIIKVLLDYRDEVWNKLRVKLSPLIALDDIDDFIDRKSSPMRAISGQSDEDIGYRDYPGHKGNILSHKTPWIPGAVIPLVMVHDDREDLLKKGKGGEYLYPIERMSSDNLPFLGIEFVSFFYNPSIYTHHPHIVQEGTVEELVFILWREY